MAYIFEALAERLSTLKHASHDQSTHGRRGGGGGSAVPEFARAKPVPAGQTSLFDIFDAPTPAPTPAPTVVQPQSRVQVHAAEIRGAVNDVIAEAEKIGARVSPETKNRINELSDRVAQHANETNEMRKAALYDAQGNYIATPEQRKAFHAEMKSRAAAIRAEIVDEANRLVAAEEANSPNAYTQQAIFGSAGILLRETMRNPDSVHTTLLPDPTTVTDPLNPDMRSAAESGIRHAENYVHRSPDEVRPIYVTGADLGQYVAGTHSGGRNPMVPSTIKVNNAMFTSPTVSKFNTTEHVTVNNIAIHEFGHALDAAKMQTGSVEFSDKHIREFLGDKQYVDRVRQANSDSKRYGRLTYSVGDLYPLGTKRSQMLIPYQTTAYFNTMGLPNANTPPGQRAPKFVPSLRSSEYTSTLLEKIHGQHVTKMNAGVFTYLIAQQEPRNFDFVYAQTQY